MCYLKAQGHGRQSRSFEMFEVGKYRGEDSGSGVVPTFLPAFGAGNGSGFPLRKHTRFNFLTVAEASNETRGIFRASCSGEEIPRRH
jgi:hypothetical protein